MFDMDAMTLTAMLILAGTALLVALVAGAVWPRRWRLVALLVGGLFPAFIIANVVAGLVRNPKSNNLWPVAVAIACAVTLPPAYVGAGAGEMIARLMRRPPSGGQV
jgi:hypothetical protein